MKDNPTARERYLELTALLIDRELAKFRRGEQAALVSFTNVANLARNASEELMAPGPAARAAPMPARVSSRIGATLSSANDDETRAIVGSRDSDVDRFLGLRIKQLRLRAGMTQQQLARQLSVSNEKVHKYEKGLSRFSAERLLAIVRLLHVTVADLFDGYHGGAPLGLREDPKTSRMLLNITASFIRLEPKHQDAVVRLAQAMADG